MPLENSVYELLPMLDTPGYGDFGVCDSTSITGGYSIIGDCRTQDASTRNWQAPRLKERWRPLKIFNGKPDEETDYFALGLQFPAFSERAIDALIEYLEPNGEILPLVCETGRYSAFNVTAVADVLNRQTSDIEWFPWYRLKKMEPIVARSIKRYDFFGDRLSDLSIFRIPEDLSGFYVTEKFARRVSDKRLRGFNLKHVWSQSP
jgi:hypothetical protein